MLYVVGNAMLKIAKVWVVICLCAHSLAQQTVPYITFMGQTLANHSYVNLGLVGNNPSGNNRLHCHTDLMTCCSMAQGPHRGDWYFPKGNLLPQPPGNGDSFESRQPQRVELRRTGSIQHAELGIYHCDIETDAVHDNGARESVYVGLYLNNGK